ncbi:T9SS type A sorting domain-containing protein [Flavobacterium sp. SUN052]|uniref:DUF7619 domain-containing protein n=1 Tax=Flavobacterium sp. SUN052 TaxID=3002441 RepID=UPI00237EDB49|nr:T9SS type A sorting domain-containing protein [Flavobacterium sp. SUN052]MEC4004270.1 T9SS type A sorting domain-containing protein [Flavobacterium sp. SUN052]
MKTKLYLGITLLFLSVFGYSQVSIPDANFKAKLLQASTGIQIAKNIAGQWFKIDANSDGQIQTTEAQQVSALYVNFSNISNMTGIASFTNLKVLSCFNNSVTSLNVSTLSILQELYCYNNSLTSLIVAGTALKRLDCFNNPLTALNLTGLNTLQYLDSTFTKIANINTSNLTNLESLYFGGGIQSVWYLENLNVSGCTSLVNITGFIEEISLQTANFSNCTGLQSINLNNCFGLNTLNVLGCTNLQALYVNRTSLTSLNVSGLTNLTSLTCTESQLTSLNVVGLNNLSTLNCSINQLPALNLTGLINLTSVTCSENQLLSLNLSGLSNLNSLNCRNNQLLSLDVSECYNIGSVDCQNNQLLSIFMKNGKLEGINSGNNSAFNFNNNPILLYICTDEGEMNAVQNYVSQLGYSNCQVNTYCSFVPGGFVYLIEGASKLDANANGCDPSDLNYSHLKYDVTNGTISGSIIADTTGTYSIPVTVGTHTVTPVLENPTYFNVSPSNVQVSFPATATPFTQNFCITPNGAHPDLEITIVPINTAIPGFNVNYKLVFKNKGNTVISGLITLSFDDALMDFISANPIITNQITNLLTWNYTNLEPFETRNIVFNMNLNAPTDTPPLNANDILNFTAIINPVGNDETPSDNQFDFPQYVFNSLDPNDKICLEGTTINPSMIGKYIHYKIRFENTGNFPAQNIVVKDIIDTTMFDITSIQITDSSHSCVTKITNDNKVEFIFENINLPIDDANNDGYVVFKIKTKPTVVLNDILTNQANIYFDYNFPVTTNQAQTIVQTLNNQQFNNFNIKVYPNPVKDILTIQSQESINKVDVYDANGRLLMSSQLSNNQTDLSTLSSGFYFVKIVSNDKVTVIKITKE